MKMKEKIHRRYVNVLVSAIIIIVFLCGCGGGGGSNSAGSSTGGSTGSGGGGSTPSVSPPEETPDSATGDVWNVKADLSGAVGLVLVAPDAYKSYLKKVLPGSILTRVFDNGKSDAEGDVYVRGFYIASDNSVYVHLDSVTLNSKPCIFVRITQDGNMACLENSTFLYIMRDESVQEDGFANVYYTTIQDDDHIINEYNPSSKTKSERYRGKIEITSYHVTSVGDIYISGYWDDSHSCARIDDAGNVNMVLKDCINTAFIDMPDGNVYLADEHGVRMIEDDSVNSLFYITADDPTAFFDVNNNAYGSCFGCNGVFYEDFCSWKGGGVDGWYKTDSGKVYVIAGFTQNLSGTLWQYWPTVEPKNIVLNHPKILKGFENTLYVTGTNGSDYINLVRYDSDSGIPLTLVEGVFYEIYQFDYSPIMGKVLFIGKDMTTGEEIVAVSDPEEYGAVTMYDKGESYLDLKVFR